MKKLFLFFLISTFLTNYSLAIPCNNEKLFAAAKGGKIKEVEAFKKAKCSLTVKDSKGFSPFDLAAIYGNASLMEKLISFKDFKRGEFSPALLRYVQVGLRYLNFDAGPANGKLNQTTTNAIKRYQKSIKQEANGKIQPRWLVAFRKDLIKKAQSDLKKMGYKIGSVDGMWGSSTKTALMEFAKRQKINSPSYDGLYEGVIYRLMIADNERNKKVIEKKEKETTKKAKEQSRKEIARREKLRAEEKKEREREAREKKLAAQRHNQQMMEEARKRKVAEDRRRAELQQRRRAEEAEKREVEAQREERQRAIEEARRREQIAREREERMRELEEDRQRLAAQRQAEQRLAEIQRQNAENQRKLAEERAKAEAEQREKLAEQRAKLEAQRRESESKLREQQEKAQKLAHERQKKAEAITKQLNTPTEGGRTRKKNNFRTISGILLFSGENNCSINGQTLQSGWCRSYYTTGNGKKCDAVISRSGTVVSLRCK